MTGSEVDSNGGAGAREQEIAELEARLSALRAETAANPPRGDLASTAPSGPETPNGTPPAQTLSEVLGELLRPETIGIVGSNIGAAYRELSAMSSQAVATSTLRLRTPGPANPLLNAFSSKQTRASKEFRAVVAAHLDELARARMQTVRMDRYGRAVVDDWMKEAAYFLNTVARPALARFDAKTITKLLETDGKWFFNLVEARSEELARSMSFSKSMSPVQYEEFCAQLLGRSGWSARTTKATGDQGIDVIAIRRGVRLVIQCKLYDGPVGNSAVQEAVSGKLHERADIAAVVTNSTFTPAARQLASSTGTLLLHHTELERL
jgi:restriction system protein